MSNITFVDDDPLQINLFKAILQKANYTIFTYPTAFETLECIDKNPFDPILIDLSLLIMNGFEFVDVFVSLRNLIGYQLLQLQQAQS